MAILLNYFIRSYYYHECLASSPLLLQVHMRTYSALLNNTEQCVMCGLCLPHCPTYRIGRNEGESPRGRISLIKAYAQGELGASPAIQTHLQSCTACMKCEQVCPANVPYQSILDAGRELYRSRLDFRTRSIQSIAVYLLSKRWGHGIFRILRAGASLLIKLGIFTHLEPIQLATVLHGQSNIKINIPINQSEKRVTLFPGCTAELFDRETLNSALNVINALDYETQLSNTLHCCSALAQHSGLLTLAQQQRQQTRAYLDEQETADVISIASGCGQQLDRDADAYSTRHYDIHTWLLNDNRYKHLKLRPLAKKVLVHVPCSMHSKQAQAMLSILNAIPNITLLLFNDNLDCCGAGGMQILTPEASNQALLHSKIETVVAMQPDIIVTANIGCSLQLRKGLKQANLKIAVIHPVTLVNQQLEN